MTENRKSKTAYAQRLMIPEVDTESTQFQNQEHFINQLLPLLEHIRKTSPSTYQDAIDKFREHWESKIHATNLNDMLEYLLTYLKNTFGLQFYLEESTDTYHLEVVDCPLVENLKRKGLGELDRKILCWHCSQYHYLKFLRIFSASARLELHPRGCGFAIEKEGQEPVTPLFY